MIVNGTLNINGSYETSSNGYIKMWYEGSVNVGKDFTIKNDNEDKSDYSSYSSKYYHHFSNGTLSIGGNFYQYNNGTVTKNFVQHGTKIKFVGSGVHEIHSQSSNTTISKDTLI